MSSINANDIHEPKEITCHLVDRICNFGSRTLASSTVVMNDDAKLLGKLRNLRLPVVACASKSRHEQEGRPGSMGLVVDFTITY